MAQAIDVCPYDDLTDIIKEYPFWDPSSIPDMYLYYNV